MTSLLRRAQVMRRSLKQAVSVPALLAVAVFVFPAAGGFTEEEFQCEEAAATLEDCCEDLAVTALSCSRETGCAGETLRSPVLAISESECIEQLSCNEIAKASICERVAVRQQKIVDDDPAPFENGPVCP